MSTLREAARALLGALREDLFEHGGHADQLFCRLCGGEWHGWSHGSPHQEHAAGCPYASVEDALNAPPPAPAELRDAAHALRAAIQRHCRAGQLTAIEPELTALFLAADAPPPAPDELRRKLRGLWDLGVYAGSGPGPGVDDCVERDRLIDELLAMWPRAIPEPRGCPTPGACSCGGMPPGRDEDDLR